MPQVYRRHSDYNPRTPVVPRRRSSMAPPGPQPTDADDSIVLADLVRTGEASRLRRRGAMRLDHGPTAPTRVPLPSASTAGPSSYAPSARPIIIEPSRTPSPELNADDNGGDEYTYTAGPAWRGVDAFPSRDSGRAEGVQTVEILSENIQAGQSYILYCGGEDAALSDDEEDERPPPFQPSLFPIMPPAGGRSSRPQRKSIRRTNGCGALVHVRAYPQRPRGVWMAKEEASETVVGLDAQYCDHSSMDKMLKSACGCIREGIGCSVWCVCKCCASQRCSADYSFQWEHAWNALCALSSGVREFLFSQPIGLRSGAASQTDAAIWAELLECTPCVATSAESFGAVARLTVVLLHVLR